MSDKEASVFAAPVATRVGEHATAHGKVDILCVDLDGSLIKSDLLFEGLAALIKRNPLTLFIALLWLLRGKARFKAEVAARVDVDPALLPFNAQVLTLIDEYARRGARVILATASHRRMASAVARHIGKFDLVLATEAGCNMSGARKLRAIVDAIGTQRFAYVGNARDDLAVWEKSAVIYAVNPGPSVLSRLHAIGRQPAQLITTKRPFLESMARAMRPHQWLKNVLVFVPVIAAHEINQWMPVSAAALMFIAFSLTASSIYLINDLADLDADRLHPRKRRRPFAAGDLPVVFGIVLAPVLFVSGLAVALLTNHIAAALLFCYALASVSYTLLLKQYVVLDVITLASLYTLRIVAAAAACLITPSFWLLAFSMFLFLSLATMKRVAEIHALAATGATSAAGRDYRVADAGAIRSLGITGGYLSVLVFALYMNAPEIQAQYKMPQALWAISVVLLYWLGRLWVKTDRGEMHDDPLIFAALDWNSRVLAIFCVAVILVATVGWS